MNQLFFLTMLYSKLLLIIRLSRVKCRCRIISRYTVLGYKRSDIRIRVLIEQTIMSYTETDDHIQVCLCLVQ